MRPATYSVILTAILLLTACGAPADPTPDLKEDLASRSDELALETTWVFLEETTDSSSKPYPIVLVPGPDRQWSAAFRLLCEDCAHALSAFGFPPESAQWVEKFYSEEALRAGLLVGDKLKIVDLPLEKNMSEPAVLAAYRVVDATEPETPRYLVRLRERPELAYATTCETFLSKAQGSTATIPINKNLLAYWGLPAVLPRIECKGTAPKLPAPAPAPVTINFGTLANTAILSAWTATRPMPELRAERYPYLVTRVDGGARHGFAIDCGAAGYDALLAFGVAQDGLRGTPATDAELEGTQFGARPTLRCRGNDPQRILAISSPDDWLGKVRFVFAGHRDVVEFQCPETEAFWRAQAGDSKVAIPLGALSHLNDFRDDGGPTQIHPVGCRYNVRSFTRNSIKWPGSALCVSALRNMTAKDPLQLEACSPPSNGSAIARQSWSYDISSGLFTHPSDDGKLMLLDHPLGSPAGTQLEIYPWTALDSQKWSLSLGVVLNSGLCLDVANGNFNAYARLWFWPCHGGFQQRFFFPGDGTIRPVAEPNLCVDNDHDGSADGNPIQLYPCNGTQAQKWTFNAGALTNVRGCLDLDNAKGVVAGSLAQLWSCNKATNQTFQYFGKIKNKQGHCMDVREGGRGAGVVQGAACTSDWSQDFYYAP